MELKLIEKKEVPLLSRTEIKGELSFTGKTPSNDEVTKKISSDLKVDAATIVIKHVYTGFGATKAKVIAHVYKTADDKTKIEPKVKVKKAKVEEKKE